MRRMRLWAGTVACGTLLGAGCVVWESDYDKLKQELDDYRALSEARDAKNQETIQRLEDALRFETERAAALEKQIEALNAEKVALSIDKSRLQATEAELVKALRAGRGGAGAARSAGTAQGLNRNAWLRIQTTLPRHSFGRLCGGPARSRSP